MTGRDAKDPDPKRCRTVIVGLGNPLRGDDGVGIRVIQALSESAAPVHGDVELVDGGTAGLGLVNTFESRERVILVDAADMGQKPGHVTRFTLEHAELLGTDEHLSIHGAGLRDALRLAQALKVLPEEVVIFGVQPANVDWNVGLSSEVEASLPALIAAVREEAANPLC